MAAIKIEDLPTVYDAKDTEESIYKFWEENGYHLLSHSRASLYERFVEFIKDRKDYEGLVEVIRLDYLLNQNSPPKDYLNPQNLEPSEYHELLKDEKIRKDFNLDLSIPTKKLVKEFKFQGFGFGGQSALPDEDCFIGCLPKQSICS